MAAADPPGRPPPLDVTVVVPAYRADRTLPAAVAALLAQRTDLSYEVVVVASADPGARRPTCPPTPGCGS